MKAFRLVFALVLLAMGAACSGDSPTAPKASAPSYNTGIGSPGGP